MVTSYHRGLLYLVKLLIDADGIADEKELAALRKIKDQEGIPDETFQEFENSVRYSKEREIYDLGIDLISQCSEAERLRAFSILYRLSEVDGRVHVKEIKLLLYSIKSAGVEFESVVEFAKNKLTRF